MERKTCKCSVMKFFKVRCVRWGRREMKKSRKVAEGSDRRRGCWRCGKDGVGGVMWEKMRV